MANVCHLTQRIVGANLPLNRSKASEELDDHSALIPVYEVVSVTLLLDI